MTKKTEIKISKPSRVVEGIGLNPNALLDALIAELRLKNDAALCRKLDVAQSVISKVRHHRVPVTASLLIKMHDVTGRSVRELRGLMDDHREIFSAVPVRPKLLNRRLG